ncbi:MAG: J domain-containing protein [Armatimonadia bacterium]
MTDAFPLKWPAGRPRKPAHSRKLGRFKRTDYRTNRSGPLTVADALNRLRAELNRIDARHFVVSSNLQIRQDGLPRSGQRQPEDPGVCVYFQLGGKPRAMPCDTYQHVEDNIAAIAAHIEATRAIERHGVATLSEMFDGFTALPPAAGSKPKRQWWEVMGFTEFVTTRSEVEQRYRELAKKLHPDAGGNPEAMAELNQAREEALKG